MHSTGKGFTVLAGQVAMACLLAGLSAGMSADATAQPSAAAGPGLKALFDAAWARQPEAVALQERRTAAQAQRRAAEAWTPEPPAFEARHRSDRLTGNDGARELEIGVALPLWLPGERRGAGALADAEAATVEHRTQAARLRLAASLREAWWAWHRTRVDVDVAGDRLESARLLAADVARRVRAGELARADRHQADGAVAAAEAGLAQAQAESAAALQQLEALTGAPVPASHAGLPPSEPEPDLETVGAHPALAELQARGLRAERAAALVATQGRAHPELVLATTHERGVNGERYDQTLTLAVRIPFGAGPRHESRTASARADALEAQTQLALERERLRSERDAAAARVTAARTQLAAAERRAALASETRGFFEKSFRLGETDLPMRLRIDAEASEAERDAARSRIGLALALSAWRQALGLLPQ